MEKFMPEIESLKRQIDCIKLEIDGYEKARAYMIEEDSRKKCGQIIAGLREVLATLERLMEGEVHLDVARSIREWAEQQRKVAEHNLRTIQAMISESVRAVEIPFWQGYERALYDLLTFLKKNNEPRPELEKIAAALREKSRIERTRDDRS